MVFVFDFLMFVFIFTMFGEIVISNIGSILLSGYLAFLLNQVWVYKTKLNLFQLLKFILSLVVSLVLNSTLMLLIMTTTSASVQVTRITVSVILLPFNFLLSTILFGHTKWKQIA